MNVRRKNLLILGGTNLSCEIIKSAKKLGVNVIVTDYLEDSPGKKIADKSYMVSTTDIDGVVELINQEKIDGVLTGFIDSMLPYYNAICKKAGIPCYGTLEQFKIATDKEEFKKLCKRFDIPVVKEYRIDYPFTNEDIKDLQYPVLIKPVDNSGARGIFICHNADKLMEKYPISLSFSKSKKVIIEKYMSFKEATIFYLIQNGDIVLSSMADRHVKNGQGSIIPLPVGYTFPSQYLKRYQETLNQKVIRMFKSIGIKNGMIFIQTFIEEDECVFYEMGYRLTGSLEYKIIKEMNGINPIELMINYAITGSMCDKSIKKVLNPNYSRFGFNITFLTKPGKIGRIIGIEDVKKLENVIDVVCSYEEGDQIPDSALGTLKQVIIRVFGTTNTKHEMIELINKIHGLVYVYSEDGDNMLLEGMDTNTL
jgi:biotin carboxylase